MQPSGRKHRRPRTTHIKKSYQRRDNKKLHILRVLNSEPYITRRGEKVENHGASLSEIKGSVSVNSQGHDPIVEALADMESLRWIEIEKHGKRFVLFKITEQGVSVFSEALRLCTEKHPISQLEAFRGLIPEPQS